MAGGAKKHGRTAIIGCVSGSDVQRFDAREYIRTIDCSVMIWILKDEVQRHKNTAANFADEIESEYLNVYENVSG